MPMALHFYVTVIVSSHNSRKTCALASPGIPEEKREVFCHRNSRPARPRYLLVEWVYLDHDLAGGIPFSSSCTVITQ